MVDDGSNDGKEHWPDPHRFNLDRHKAGKKQMLYTWLAFGGGPRNCIGAAYGQLEANVVLGYLLRRFELKLEDRHVSPFMGATLGLHPGVKMRV